MKKLFILAFACVLCFSFTACGKKEERNSGVFDTGTGSGGSAEKKVASTSAENPEHREEGKDSDTSGGVSSDRDTASEEGAKDSVWVKDAEFFTEKPGTIPVINEDVFGEPAEEFNTKVKSIYEDLVDDGADVGANATYETDTNEELRTYSVEFKYKDAEGVPGYRVITFDLDDKHELTYRECLKRTGYTDKVLNSVIEDYYTSLYTTMNEIGKRRQEEDYDVYVAENLKIFRKGVKGGKKTDPVYFSVKKGGLALYFTKRAPDSKKRSYTNYYPRYRILDSALLNAKGSALLAYADNPSGDQIKGLEFAGKVNAEKGKTPERYYFVVLKDNTVVRFDRIDYVFEKNKFKKGKTIYKKNHKRGDVIFLKTSIPDSIPNLQVAAYHAEEENGKRKMFYVRRELYYNGRYLPPSIEYLYGKRVKKK